LANVDIAEAMKMSQHEDGALIQFHRHQCVLDFAAQFGTAQPVIGQRLSISHLFVDLTRKSPAVAQIDGLIERDPVYPAEKLELGIKTFEIAKSLEENVLCDITRIFAIVKQSVSHVENRLLVPVHQTSEGFPVASK
jgi:hypothetical protein